MKIIFKMIPLCVIFFLTSCTKQTDKMKMQNTQDTKDSKDIKDKKDMKESDTGNNLRAEFKLTSSAFEDGLFIPKKYTCNGENFSPPLKWNRQDNVKSYLIIMDDPDAPGGVFVHWVIYNIPQDITELRENFSSADSPSAIYPQGVNGFGKSFYKGPCPPSGIHRYFLKLYALDTMLEVRQDVTVKELADSMNGHIINQTSLMGKYKQ